MIEYDPWCALEMNEWILRQSGCVLDDGRWADEFPGDVLLGEVDWRFWMATGENVRYFYRRHGGRFGTGQYLFVSAN